ncbi:CzcE family metal-binding protein [Undibacterium arcticum]
MQTKSLVATVLSLTLSLSALSSMAATPVKLLGDPASATAGERTITITPDTRYVNVEGGQTVNFDVGGKTFTWTF